MVPVQTVHSNKETGILDRVYIVDRTNVLFYPSHRGSDSTALSLAQVKNKKS